MTASTDWEGLKPQNVVQAAKADMARRRRNEIRGGGMTDEWHKICKRYGEEYERYAFLREHVKQADGTFGLIQMALDCCRRTPSRRQDPESWLWARLAKTTNVHTKHLYSPLLLTAALELEKK